MVRIAQVDGGCATDCTVEGLRAIRAAGQAVHCVDIDLQMSSLASAARSPLYPPAGPRGPALPILASGAIVSSDDRKMKINLIIDLFTWRLENWR